MGKLKVAEISIKTLQQELIELTNSYNKHDYKLGMIFNSFDNFQSSPQKSIHTGNDCVDMIEASNLGGMVMAADIPGQLIL